MNCHAQHDIFRTCLKGVIVLFVVDLPHLGGFISSRRSCWVTSKRSSRSGRIRRWRLKIEECPRIQSIDPCLCLSWVWEWSCRSKYSKLFLPNYSDHLLIIIQVADLQILFGKSVLLQILPRFCYKRRKKVIPLFFLLKKLCTFEAF